MKWSVKNMENIFCKSSPPFSTFMACIFFFMASILQLTNKQKKSSFKRRAVKKRERNTYLTSKEKKARNNIDVRNGSFKICCRI
jgi:hypothetical protein